MDIDVPKCNYKGCDKSAKWNIQTGGYVLYTIDEKGEYSLYKRWAEGEQENDHYCDEHAKSELDIDTE